MPPSTNSSTPATQLLSSEARKETAFATSSVVPTRPSGMPGTACSTNCDTCCSLIPRLVWYPGVGTTPGLMTLTRMFLPLKIHAACARKRAHRRLAGAVDAQGHQAGRAGDRGVQDDRTAVTKKRQRLLHREQQALHVGVEDLVHQPAP